MSHNTFGLAAGSILVVGVTAILGLFTYYYRILKTTYYPTTAPRNIEEAIKEENNG